MRDSKTPPTFATEELIAAIYGVTIATVHAMDVRQRFAAVNHIAKVMEEVAKYEVAMLEVDEDPLAAQAGAEQMHRYGALNVLAGVAEKYGKLPHEVEQLPYSSVIVLASFMRTQNQIARRYHELAMKK